MKKIKLKKPVMYGITAGACTLLLGALFYVDYTNKNLAKEPETDDVRYVSRLFEEDIPVVSVQSVIIRPYINDQVKIVQNFYNYKGTEEEQQKAIINYEQTYIQNNGVAYGLDQAFDVVSVLDGTVTSVKEDKIMGTIVEIKA